MTQIPQKILLVRCDRIGDLLLTVPVISYLREKWNGVSLSMLVNKSTASLIKGHPGLEEVFTLDKQVENRGMIGTLKLVRLLKRNQFDAAFILHPTVRVHLIVFLTGIPRRVGYPIKWGKFLLTDLIEDRRHTSGKHEAENVLDFIDQSPWGEKTENGKWKVENRGKSYHFWIAQDEKAQEEIKRRLTDAGLPKDHPLIALHPGASDPYKRWPSERFIETGKQLQQQLSAGIAVVAGSSESSLGMKVAKQIPGAIDFSGKTTLLELTALLKRSRLLISNDSGPVHVAVAVGTPVLSLFGRDHPGLGPVRWRPLGKKDRYLFKRIGTELENLSAITVEEVVTTVKEMLV